MSYVFWMDTKLVNVLSTTLSLWNK